MAGGLFPIPNTLNGMDTNTLAEALAAQQAQELAMRTQQATEAASQAGQEYGQLASAPPPGLTPEQSFLPTLIGNIASVISQNPDFRKRAQDNLDMEKKALLDARAQNLRQLQDVYGQKAQAAKEAGDIEAQEKAHTQREKISNIYAQILDMQKRQGARELEDLKQKNRLERDKNKPAGGGGVYGQVLSQSDPQAIAKAIEEGRAHPDPSKLGRVVGPVVASILAKDGYNQQRALQDYNAVARHFATLNGRLQLQIRQSANTVLRGLDDVEELTDKLYSMSPRSRNTPINQLIVRGSREWGLMSPEAQNIATELNGQVATLIPELSNVYSAGGVPTDQAMRLAERVINANWPPNRIKAGINRERVNLKYRVNSINQVEAVTPSSVEAGGYTPPTEERVKVVGPGGRRGTMKKGGKLPAGWKVVP